MNLPNILTMSRLGLAFVMMLLLEFTFPFSKTLALLVFAIAGITDYLDGYIARRQNLTTQFGKLMDPLTDKVMVCAAFVSFVGVHISTGGVSKSLVPAWIVVVIISREFLVTGLRLLAAGKGNIIPAGKWGKHKTVWQIIAIITILLGLSIRHDYLTNAAPKDLALFDLFFRYIAVSASGIVAVITVASGLLYFTQHRELLTRRNMRPSPGDNQ